MALPSHRSRSGLVASGRASLQTDRQTPPTTERGTARRIPLQGERRREGRGRPVSSTHSQDQVTLPSGREGQGQGTGRVRGPSAAAAATGSCCLPEGSCHQPVEARYGGQPSQSGGKKSETSSAPTREASQRACNLDEELAMAMLEQELHEERERERQLRARQRARQEDELLAMMLALTQAQAEEEQQLQDALEASSCEDFKEIQRQSILETLRTQLPCSEWSPKDVPAECALCLDEYVPGDCVTRLNCFHVFHTACLDPWLGKNATCPSCKLDLLSEWPFEG
mmetsp:Transcript_47436/g.88764  ORF Transcript_47436/g.88764 Transcript_47436/m.88764 type:complete len:283 (+) Transcript_47436:39-887(+)